MRSAPLLLLALGALTPTGCASGTGVSQPRVLADGDDAISFGLDLGVSFAKLSPTQAAPAPWPQLNLGYRRGTGGFEVGARTWGFGLLGYFYTFGAALDFKVPIYQAPSIDDGFDLSVGLDVGYHQINYAQAPIHLMVTQLPLSFGWNLGGGDQLLLGIRVADHVMGGADQTTVNMFFGGGSIGYNWRALENVDIRPELVWLYSPVPFNGLALDDDRKGLAIIQIGLGSSISL